MNRSDVLAQIASSDEFVKAWRYVTENPCSYEEFKTLRMPEDVSADAMWDLFCILRRHAGVTCTVLPWSQSKEDASWYYIPKTVDGDIDRLTSLCADSSFFGAYLASDQLTDFAVLGDVFKEIASLAWRDGLDIEPTVVGRIWLNAKSPANDAERVIANLSRLFHSVKRFKERRLTFTLVEDIHELLIEGIGELNVERRRMLSDDLYWPERADSHEFAVDMVERICDLARSAQHFRNPVLVSLEMSDVFWDLPVFPSLNALTELLVRRVYLMKAELTALSYVPYSACREDFGKTYIEAYETRYRGDALGVRTVAGLDCSLLYIGSIKTYLQGAERLVERARKAQTKTSELRTVLAADRDLNERQRRVIVIAASRPGYSIGIQDYADLFHVVYSTARNDLLHLAERGYFTCRKKNREMLYRIRPKALSDLREANSMPVS